jgi:hypothetical protein
MPNHTPAALAADPIPESAATSGGARPGGPG